MKELLFIFPLLISSIISSSQKSQIIQDSGDNKATIYSKTLTWVAHTWNSSNKNIELNDTSGTIIVKGALASKPMIKVPLTKGLIPMDGCATTMVTILFRDGKAKISFDDIKFEFSDEIFNDNVFKGTVWNYNDALDDSRKKSFDKWIENVDTEIKSLVASYQEALLSKPEDF
jgi:hypothetical protein